MKWEHIEFYQAQQFCGGVEGTLFLEIIFAVILEHFLSNPFCQAIKEYLLWSYTKSFTAQNLFDLLDAEEHEYILRKETLESEI